MSYTIYTGRGIVLRERSIRESDSNLKILTEDFGLIRAIATGLRQKHSKRRAPLTELSLSRVSLVRGRYEWRVTNADLELNIFNVLRKNRKILRAVAQALSLTEALLADEEKQPQLLNTLYEFIYFAKENETEGIEDIFESILVARILSILGYLSQEEFPKKIFISFLSQDFFENSKDVHSNLVRAINKGIRESGLVK